MKGNRREGRTGRAPLSVPSQLSGRAGAPVKGFASPVLLRGREWTRLHGPLTGARPFRWHNLATNRKRGKAEPRESQAARASSRILFHWPCSVVMELNSGKGTGTR